MMSSDGVNESRGLFFNPRKVSISRYIDITGLGRREFVRFEEDVCSLRESSCRISVLSPTGQEVHKSETHNDFYGFLTSPLGVLPYIPAMLKTYVPAPGSPFTVALHLEVVDQMVIKSAGEPFYKKAQRYQNCPRDWYETDLEAEAKWLAARDVARGDLGMRPLQSTVVLDTAIWSDGEMADPVPVQIDRLRAKLVELCSVAGSNVDVEKNIEAVCSGLQDALSSMVAPA